jgi:hypothetical protein
MSSLFEKDLKSLRIFGQNQAPIARILRTCIRPAATLLLAILGAVSIINDNVSSVVGSDLLTGGDINWAEFGACPGRTNEKRCALDGDWQMHVRWLVPEFKWRELTQPPGKRFANDPILHRVNSRNAPECKIVGPMKPIFSFTDFCILNQLEISSLSIPQTLFGLMWIIETSERD